MSLKKDYKWRDEVDKLRLQIVDGLRQISREAVSGNRSQLHTNDLEKYIKRLYKMKLEIQEGKSFEEIEADWRKDLREMKEDIKEDQPTTKKLKEVEEITRYDQATRILDRMSATVDFHDKVKVKTFYGALNRETGEGSDLVEAVNDLITDIEHPRHFESEYADIEVMM